MTHKNDEHAREVEKLRTQIQSMEEEIRRLYQSRYQLEQTTKPKRKAHVATLQSQITNETLRAEGRSSRLRPRPTAFFQSGYRWNRKRVCFRSQDEGEPSSVYQRRRNVKGRKSFSMKPSTSSRCAVLTYRVKWCV